MYKKIIIKERDKYLFNIGRTWLNTDDSSIGGELFDVRKSWGDFPSDDNDVAFVWRASKFAKCVFTLVVVDVS